MSGGSDLAAMRAEIEAIDDQLVELMARRVTVARRIGALKRDGGRMVLDPAREAEVVRRAGERARERGLAAEDVRAIFWSVIALARDAQMP